MDFGLRSARYRRDITSLTLERNGQYDFGLTLQRYVVLPAAHTVGSDTPTRLEPSSLESTSAYIMPNEDSLFLQSGELRAIFSNQVATIMSPVLEYDQTQNIEQNDSSDQSQNVDLDADFEFDFDFNAQAENAPHDLEDDQDTSQFNNTAAPPFVDSFTQDIPRLSSNDFPEPSQDLSPDPTPTSNGTISNDDFSLTLSLALGSPSPAPSPPSFTAQSIPLSTSSTTASTSIISPHHRCRICSIRCKRAQDLKRHLKIHFPEQRNFHCYTDGCDRNGRNGFYRRDKLRAHQKQVHDF